MNRMGAYVWARRGVLAAFLGCVLIFWLVFSLYELPGEAVLYAALLSSIWLLGLGVWDALRFSGRLRALQELRRDIDVTDAMPQDLPKAWDAVEQAYRELLFPLFSQRRALEQRSRRERREALDYYTLWLHQIKTPIAAMNLILQQENLPQKMELQSQLFQIERYVEMVLIYLRMGSESTDYVIAECDLDEVVRQALHKYAPIFIRKKIALHLSPISMRVLTDEKWLCFCMEQILSNAVKYTPQGGSVSIYTQVQSLIVQDEGIGISPWDLPRIFEKGFTGENGRLDKRASGIGLYLTKQVLQRLGHGIDIESQQGFGTRVRLHFYTDTPVLE